jgi:hypothetical protein
MRTLHYEDILTMIKNRILPEPGFQLAGRNSKPLRGIWSKLDITNSLRVRTTKDVVYKNNDMDDFDHIDDYTDTLEFDPGAPSNRFNGVFLGLIYNPTMRWNPHLDRHEHPVYFVFLNCDTEKLVKFCSLDYFVWYYVEDNAVTGPLSGRFSMNIAIIYMTIGESAIVEFRRESRAETWGIDMWPLLGGAFKPSGWSFAL